MSDPFRFKRRFTIILSLTCILFVLSCNRSKKETKSPEVITDSLPSEQPEISQDSLAIPTDTLSLSEETSPKDSTDNKKPRQDSDTPESTETGYQFPYRLDQPNEVHKLPGRLREISAIAFINDHEVACVQDEKGKIYIYDLKKEEVEEEFEFWKDGDYEGIAIVGKTAYVLRMDGNIYEVENFLSKKKRKTEKHKTFLKAANDAEGLCYDDWHKRLLVALKGQAGDGQHLQNKKAVYAFDLATKELRSHPVFLIDLDQVRSHLERNKMLEAYEKLAVFFNPGKGSSVFQPSEIAIHPITRHVYISSSVGKILMVLDQTGKLLHLESLDRKLIVQPEGLAFFANGDLLISSEGKSGKGKIFKFHYTK